ncbi:MAG: hypothetical protein JWM34_3903 [Ilumatobacteraceae bacterium]|nr:hypothetical protein [Ilumatobacteraceae bacterium]
MAGWTRGDLDRMGASEELDLASRRDDGSLGRFVTMWVVRVGDDVYVRSAGGADRPWYRHAVARGLGAIRAGGVSRDVAFEGVDPRAHRAIDAAYQTKYDRYGPTIVGSVIGAAAHAVAIRLVPTGEPA